MSVDRRTFVAGVALILAHSTTVAATAPGDQMMYGLISKMVAQPGRRDALVKILLAGMAKSVDGCLNYIVATDPSDANSLWVTEVWQSRQAHAASLSLPSVNEAMSQGRPLIASFLRIAETAPIGGIGISSQSKE